MEKWREVWKLIRSKGKYKFNKIKYTYSQPIQNTAHEQTLESVEERLEKTGRFPLVHNPSVAKTLVRQWCMAELLPIKLADAWRTKYVARERDIPYEKKLFEANKSSRVSRIGLIGQQLEGVL